MRHIGIKTIGINQAIAALLSFLVVISSASVWVQEDLNLIPSKPVKLAIWMLAILLIVIHLQFTSVKWMANLRRPLPAARGKRYGVDHEQGN